MAILWCDQPLFYTTANIGKRWTAHLNSSISSAGTLRTGSGYVSSNSNTINWIYKGLGGADSVAPSTEYFVIFQRVNASTIGSGVHLAGLRDGATDQCSLRVDIAGSVSVMRGAFAGTVLGSSAAGVVSAGATFTYLFKGRIHNTLGEASVTINGTEVLSLTSQDTQVSANQSYNTVIHNLGSNAAGEIRFTDTIYADAYASLPNQDYAVDYLPASSGNGDHTGWTASTGSNHGALVDDAQTDIADYNSAITVGLKDSYDHAALATAAQVLYVTPLLAMEKDDAGTKEVRPFFRIGTTDYNGTTQTLQTGGFAFHTDPTHANTTINPATSTAWTPTALNAAEIGVEVIT